MSKTNNLIPTVSLSASWTFDKVHKNRKKLQKQQQSQLFILLRQKRFTPQQEGSLMSEGIMYIMFVCAYFLIFKIVGKKGKIVNLFIFLFSRL